MTRIAIIGTGRIGTSLGLALRAAPSKPIVELWGYDQEQKHTSRAKELGALDKACWQILEAVENADLVVLSLPLNAIRATLTTIAPALRPDCVVTDTAFLKTPVLAWVEELLPPTVHYVGGHPHLRPLAVGAPTSGPDAANAQTFQGVPYGLVPSNSAPEEAVKLLSDLARLIGARPFFSDAAEHDGLSTAVNVLPLLLGAGLLQVTTQAGNWRDLRRMAGQAFANASDIGDPAAWREAVLLSQGSVVPWLDQLLAELYTLREDLADGRVEALQARLEASQARRAEWLNDWHDAHWPDLTATGETTSAPANSDMLSRMFLGGFARLGEKDKARDKDKEKGRRS